MGSKGVSEYVVKCETLDKHPAVRHIPCINKYMQVNCLYDKDA